MGNKFRRIATLLLLLIHLAPASAQDVKLPSVTRETWVNGARVVLMESHRAPMLHVIALFPGGSSADPEGKAGVASLTASLLQRGTKSRTAPQISEAIEFLGGSLESSAGADEISVSLSLLAKDAEEGLNLLADLLRHPTFSAQELERERQLSLSDLESLAEDPGAVADRVEMETVYSGHPYGILPTIASLKAITREDLIAYGRRFITPQRMILVAVGDFKTPDEMMTKLKARFSDWQGERSDPIQLPPPPSSQRRIVLIDTPDASQTQVRWVRPAFPRNSPDWFPAHLANTLLGSGFTSRLTEEIRVNRSLTYGIKSQFDPLLEGGDFNVSTFTRIETTRPLVDATHDVLHRAATEAFTPAELKKGKDYLAGLFAIHVQTPKTLTDELADSAFYGLPDDYLETYLSNLSRVTLSDVNRIAHTYFLPDQMSLVLVAPAAKVMGPLQGLGEIEMRPVEAVGK